MRASQQQGFSLVELLIVIALLGVLSAVAIPSYNNYVRTSQEGALISTMSSMRVFQEDLMVRTGAYAAGTWDSAGGTTTLLDNLGWEPQDDDGTVYVVAVSGATYTVTATAPSGIVVCRQYPGANACP